MFKTHSNSIDRAMNNKSQIFTQLSLEDVGVNDVMRRIAQNKYTAKFLKNFWSPVDKDAPIIHKGYVIDFSKLKNFKGQESRIMANYPFKAGIPLYVKDSGKNQDGNKRISSLELKQVLLKDGTHFKKGDIDFYRKVKTNTIDVIKLEYGEIGMNDVAYQSVMTVDTNYSGKIGDVFENLYDMEENEIDPQYLESGNSEETKGCE